MLNIDLVSYKVNGSLTFKGSYNTFLIIHITHKQILFEKSKITLYHVIYIYNIYI